MNVQAGSHAEDVLGLGTVQKQIEPYIFPETKPMVAELSQSTGPAFQRLNLLVIPLAWQA